MGIAGKHYPPHVNPQQDNAEATDKAKAADERVRQQSWFGHLLNESPGIRGDFRHRAGVRRVRLRRGIVGHVQP